MGLATKRGLLMICLTAALALLGGCSSAGHATGQAQSSGVHIPSNLTGHADGTPISLTPVKHVHFAYFILPGERVYRLFYWSGGRRVEAYLDVPPGIGPNPGGAFDLLVSLHGGEVFPEPFHYKGFPTVTAQVAANEAWSQDLVFLPNYRGYGGSPGPVGGAYDSYIDTVNGLKALGELRGLRIAPRATYLEGASLGGYVAMRLAAQDPNVRAMVLDSPYPGATLTMRWFLSQSTGTLDGTDLSFETGLLRHYGADIGAPIWARRSVPFQDVRVPTLLIAGTKDPILPAALERLTFTGLMAQNPNDQLEFFPTGHAPSTQAAFRSTTDWLFSHGLNLQ